MLWVPVLWWWLHADRAGVRMSATPWNGFALLMAPFLIDVTGDILNLYDSIGWWDDANHLVNWFLLSAGVGVLLQRSSTEPPWALGLLVAGLGALLAVGWELAEWCMRSSGTEPSWPPRTRTRWATRRWGAWEPLLRELSRLREPTRRALTVRRC